MSSNLITSHHITSHHITSHHITSHHITSHHITSHHITSHHITSHHFTSHHITSHHITSHHITSHHITSHHITSHHITRTLFDVQYIVLCEKWASVVTHTLFDVQHIVLCEEGASVVVLSGGQGKGHKAVHLSSYSHSSVEVRSVLTQPLNELCADAALHHSLFCHTRVIAQRQVDKSTVTEHVNMCHLTWSGCSFCCL